MKMKRPEPTKPIDSTVMRRLDALELLINAEYSGKPKVFEEKTGIKMAQVGQWFTGYRALRDKALRRLEESTKKPAGWFDAPTVSATLPRLSAQMDASSGAVVAVQFSPQALDIAKMYDAMTDKRKQLRALMICIQMMQEDQWPETKEADSQSSAPNQSSQRRA